MHKRNTGSEKGCEFLKALNRFDYVIISLFFNSVIQKVPSSLASCIPNPAADFQIVGKLPLLNEPFGPLALVRSERKLVEQMDYSAMKLPSSNVRSSSSSQIVQCVTGHLVPSHSDRKMSAGQSRTGPSGDRTSEHPHNRGMCSTTSTIGRMEQSLLHLLL